MRAPGIIVRGEGGPIDFGRVSPEDPTEFRTLMAEMRHAANGEGGSADAIAAAHGFDPDAFSDMRSYMQRRFPAMGQSQTLEEEWARRARGQTADEGTEDRYCEIMGAMMAWASSGADINGNLWRYFQLTRNDVNSLGLRWSEASDMARIQEQANRQHVHTQRYLQMPM